MRICYVNPGLNLKRPIAYIADILSKKEYEISILIPKKQKKLTREFTRHYDSLKKVNFETYPVFTRSTGYTWPIPTNFDFLKKCVNALKNNDIVHVWVPFYPSSFIIILLKLLFFKKKMLILTMDTIPGYTFKLNSVLDPLFKLFYKTIGKIAFSSSNFITFYANSIRDFAIKVGITKNKIIITPTGINLDIKKSNSDIKHEFNISENEKLILFVGLHNERKGIDLILRIAHSLKNKDICFLMVGEGVESNAMKRSSSKLGLDRKIKFAGTRKDVHNFYNQSDLFILPSRGEGLAGVLMEAMIYQLPIITSDIVGTKDLITNMENGILCETENIDCYSKSIIKLLNDDSLRQKFKDNGVKKIQNGYLWKNNIKKFEALYRVALKNDSKNK